MKLNPSIIAAGLQLFVLSILTASATAQGNLIVQRLDGPGNQIPGTNDYTLTVTAGTLSSGCGFLPLAANNQFQTLAGGYIGDGFLVQGAYYIFGPFENELDFQALLPGGATMIRSPGFGPGKSGHWRISGCTGGGGTGGGGTGGGGTGGGGTGGGGTGGGGTGGGGTGGGGQIRRIPLDIELKPLKVFKIESISSYDAATGVYSFYAIDGLLYSNCAFVPDNGGYPTIYVYEIGSDGFFAVGAYYTRETFWASIPDLLRKFHPWVNFRRDLGPPPKVSSLFQVFDCGSETTPLFKFTLAYSETTYVIAYLRGHIKRSRLELRRTKSVTDRKRIMVRIKSANADIKKCKQYISVPYSSWYSYGKRDISTLMWRKIRRLYR